MLALRPLTLALLLALLSVFLLQGPARAADLVINTSPTVFDSALYDRVFVYDQGCTDSSCSSSPTELDVVAPAATTELRAYGQSQVDLQGGSVAYLYARQDSVVDLSGTDLTGGVLIQDRALVRFHTDFISDLTLEGNLTDTTRLEIEGGGFNTVYGRRYADITMNGGNGGTMDLTGWWGGTFTLNGGSLDNLWVSQQSLPDNFVVIRGGSVANGFSAPANTHFLVTGGSIPGVVRANYSGVVQLFGGTDITELRTFGTVDQQDARIEVFGTGFAVDGMPVPYGDVAAQSGTLTGTLSDGSPLSATFLTNGAEPYPPTQSGWYGTLHLAPPPHVPAVPAPGLALLAVSVLAAGTWQGRRSAAASRRCRESSAAASSAGAASRG